MASMNLMDVYHDPSLDGLIHGSNGYRNGSNRREGGQPRRVVSDGYSDFQAGRPPPAPEVPRGPPISYRSPGSGPDVPVQRSFSQRAKGRPYAEEAFANETAASANREPSRRHSGPSQRPVQKSAAPPPADVSPTASRRQRIIQENIRSAAEEAETPRDRSNRSYVAPQPRTADTAPRSAGSRSGNVRDTGNQTEEQNRDWAADRSPLQKLEVTLNDISKEEKRARVQEAEMILREKSRGQKSATREPASVPSQKSVPRHEPAKAKVTQRQEDPAMSRNLSGSHRERPQQSAVIDSRKSDSRRLSGEQRGVDYDRDKTGQASRVPVPKSDRNSRESGRQRVSIGSQQDGAILQAQEREPKRDQVQSTRSVQASDREPVVQAREDRTAAPRRPIQPRMRDDDRIPTAQERNASHKAALEQLTGTGAAAAAISRGDSRKLQKKMPDARAVPATSVHESVTRSQGNHQPVSSRADQLPVATGTRAMAGHADPRTPPPAALGAGLQQSPGVRSVDSPAAAETARQRQRKSSVSFKEPFDRRRPVDEWKQAETARLTAPDFIVEPTNDIEHDKAWWEQEAKARRRKTKSTTATTSTRSDPIDDHTAEFLPRLYLRCGPLLRYTGLKHTQGESDADRKETWRGSVMIVTQDSQSSYEEPPTLRLFAQPRRILPPAPPLVGEEELAPEYVDPIAGLTKLSRTGKALYIRPIEDLEEGRDLSLVETDDGLFEVSPRPMDGANDNAISMASINNRNIAEDGEKLGRYKEVKGVRLYADPDNDVTFWLFKLEIELGPEQQHIAYRINRGASTGFWVPAKGQTMNIMFHSCNGFSLSVNANEFSGPDPLWRDVLNNHQSRPFHVMLGGGDQIYNDRATTETQHFGAWSQNKNPHYKHNAPFTSEMKQELENFYLQRYCMWFSQGLFGVANSQIPMVNIWDDHDIIDGFGSYPDHFMQSPVFSGIGNVAFKYYMLFQHQSVEAMTSTDEPSWLLGYKPGPYIKQLSRSVFLELGRSVAFLGLDCRTERRRDEVISVDTCDVALERCRKEIVEGQTRHLLVLLGVPIAYPRLNWLENVLTSRAMDPLKAMGRYGMIKGGFLNKFDGGVEILDDLDDHWTASHHKEERNWFIKELQDLAAERSVRITILGGDVHLAAIGQFYSNPRLRVPKDIDHRYMPNIISSAIVNTPPPEMMADIINKRNKIHHLNEYTDESMIPMFTHDVDMKKRNNKHLLPRRNWCSISEYEPGKTPPSSRSASPESSEVALSDNEGDAQYANPKRRFSLSRDDVNPRTLLRRLSSRNAPPTSYRDAMEPTSSKPMRSASFDGATDGHSRWNGNSQPMQRSASETRDSDRRSSADQSNPRVRPPLRPGFHRRPTNLSKSAAKKGNVPAVDADGNEFDVNDHVNLEGGLDIVLNCEVNQKNPAGITTPYRLLIPALWYDGTSDLEKLPANGVNRRPTLLNRLGIGGRSGHKAAQSQGAGNWGKDDETESITASEDSGRYQQPRKKFGFLGSFRRRRDRDDYSDDEDDGMMHKETSAPGITVTQPPGELVTPKALKPGSDTLYDTSSHPGFGSNAGFNKPPKQTQQSGALDQHPFDFSTNADGRSRNIAAQSPETTALPQTATPTSAQPVNRQGSRPKSYVIGSHRGADNQQSSSAGQPTSLGQAIHDEDSMYVRQQQRSASQNTPSSFPATTYSSPPTEKRGMLRSLSKQDRVLGTGTNRDGYSDRPQQQPLRGNGIIGKNYSPTSPSSYPKSFGAALGLRQQKQSEPRGYTGIDAYRPQRRWSLRDRARNLMDRVEGRRSYGDDYDSGSDVYSDEEGAIPPAGGQPTSRPPQGPPPRFEHGPGQILPQQHHSNPNTNPMAQMTQSYRHPSQQPALQHQPARQIY